MASSKSVGFFNNHFNKAMSMQDEAFGVVKVHSLDRSARVNMRGEVYVPPKLSDAVKAVKAAARAAAKAVADSAVSVCVYRG